MTDDTKSGASTGISALCIRRPIGTSLLALASIVGGVLSFFSLPVAPLPRVDMPTIMVSSQLPGASPETMAATVATPLERRFGRIAGLSELTSSSYLGTTSIVLQFDLERDIDGAGRDVQAAINAAAGDLPSNLPTLPSYRKMNPADAPVMLLRLTSPTTPIAGLYDLASNVLAQKISRQRGVGQVTVGGGQQPAIRVRADPAALSVYGLSLEDVRNTLSLANAQAPKGRVMQSEEGWVVSINDQLDHAAQYKELIVSFKNGAPLRLKDVAEVFSDVENNRAIAWTDNQRSIILVVRRQPDANILETIKGVHALLPELQRDLPSGALLEIINDRATTIRASVYDVERTLLITIALVFLVVWLFLRDLRATLIPCTAVPLSLIATLMGMQALGYSLDNLSLMALTIATGFVVDDAIVVTENIIRLIDAGKSPIEAAKQGASEISFTIVSITLSLLAVFIPMLLMGGILGRLFREFAVTLSMAVALSALISLSVTPMMCAHLLRPHAKARPPSWLERATAYLPTQFDKLFVRITRSYGRQLSVALRHVGLMNGLTALAIVLTVALFICIPKGLVPQQDTGLLIGFTEAPQDIAFASMSKRQAEVGRIVLEDPAVAHVMSFCGAGTMGAENTGTLFVVLKDPKSRSLSADRVIARLRPKLQKLAGINLFLQAVQDVRMGGRSARTQYQYTLQSANLQQLREVAPKMLARLKELAELRDVASDMQAQGLEAHLTLDRDTISRLGVSVSSIDQVLYDAFGQRQVGTLFSDRSQYRVVLEIAEEHAKNLSALRELFVPSSSGVPVALMELVSVELKPVSLAVNHQGQFAATTLSFNLAPKVALSSAIEAIGRIEQEMKMPASVRGGLAGTAKAFGASNEKQPFLVVLALVAVYVVLGVLYESFVHPITILSTLPSAGVGALCALYFTGDELSIMAFVAIILLIGIVKKNAIMMVDVALAVQRQSKRTPREAILEASVVRLRPILMTTLAALFGGLPMALGQGPGSELRRPLGIAIVGGLMLSQLLTLYTTPAMYVALEGVAVRLVRLKKRLGSWRKCNAQIRT